MDARPELGGKSLVDHPVALDSRLAGKNLRYDIYAKVTLALRMGAGMTGVQEGFIDHVKALR